MGYSKYVLAALDGTPFFASALEIIGKIINCLITVLNTFKTSVDVMGTASADKDVAAMISAAATTVATILVVIELCTQAMGFHFEDINDAVRFVFKVVVYKIIIENSSKIVSMVYGMFMNTGAWDGIAGALSGINTRFTDTVKKNIETYYIEFANNDDSFLGINQLIVSLALVGAVIIVIIICVNIITSIAGLMFELCIDVAIAPVPIATLVNSQTRQIGINFIKGFAGNCLTLTMYTICFIVYGKLVGGISSGFSGLISNTSVFSSIGIILPEIVGLLLLSVAIKNVGNMISKVLS